MLEFTTFAKHPPGIVLQMLEAAYEAYFEIEPWCREPWLGDWREYDHAVFAEPDTVGACGFVSTLGEKAVGFASWDPRGFPVGVIGHNCVLPEFGGRGFGKLQVMRVVEILREKGFREIRATTGDNDFFLPARRMYAACGFVETGRNPGPPPSRMGIVEFSKSLA